MHVVLTNPWLCQTLERDISKRFALLICSVESDPQLCSLFTFQRTIPAIISHIGKPYVNLKVVLMGVVRMVFDLQAG